MQSIKLSYLLLEFEAAALDGINAFVDQFQTTWYQKENGYNGY
ncbi:MAG: hypothetical protein R2825_12220 [Saprospiraceae bacterium]